MIVRISRKNLFVNLLAGVVGMAIGEWLSVLSGLKPHFSFHDVSQGAWGALTFAVLLALLHAGDEQ